MLREFEFANIGIKEAARLRSIGLVGLAGALALSIWTVDHQVASWVRLALFFLVWLGTSMVLQAEGHTSIWLAARRVRRFNGREEPEPYVLALREQARSIQKMSLFVAALAVTFLVMCS